jgi:hypothetical protein
LILRLTIKNKFGPGSIIIWGDKGAKEKMTVKQNIKLRNLRNSITQKGMDP